MLSEEQMKKMIQRVRTCEASDWETKISQHPLLYCGLNDNRPFLQFNNLMNINGEIVISLLLYII